jgi:hypothetical protein
MSICKGVKREITKVKRENVVLKRGDGIKNK